MSRQQLRRHRLIELEQEQHMEDAEGLVLTEEQRQLLLGSFVSAKIEFHDLDGLRWTQTALRRRQCHRHPAVTLSQADSSFILLGKSDPPTNNDIEATIRCSTNHINANSYKPQLDSNCGLSITSPDFWGINSGMISRFPVPPSTFPSGTVRPGGYVGGLGFANIL